MLPALVLTAGLGTRLDPLTRLRAKPAVPLDDRTLIEHVLAWLTRQGVEDVVLNLHHRPASITGIVGDGRHLGLRVRYSWEQAILGSAGGPRHARPLMNAESFLIVNGDTLCDFDLAPLLAAHARTGADATLAVMPNPDPDHYNGLVLDGDCLAGVRPRGAAEGTWHFVGVQVVQPRVFDGVEDGTPAETIAGIYPEAAARQPGSIRAHRVDTSFLDVGTPRDYLRAAVSMAGGRQADPRLVRSVAWPEATIGAGARLEDAIAAGPVRVPDGFQGRGVILLPAECASDDDRAERRDGMAIFPI